VPPGGGFVYVQNGPNLQDKVLVIVPPEGGLVFVPGRGVVNFDPPPKR